MKRRRIEQEERRRPLVEPNLLGDSKTRSTPKVRGCAFLAGRIMMAVALLLLLRAGLP